MKYELSDHDISVILESLKYSRKAFEEYVGYPSEEFRRGRIDEVNEVSNKIKAAKKAAKKK